MDTGPNGLQNYPELDPITNTGTPVQVQATLESTPETQFRLEFFRNAVADPSGYGEGAVPIAQTGTVTTDFKGDAVFSAFFDPADLPVGSWVTATATPDAGAGDYVSTSEFSQAVQVTGPTISLNSKMMLEGPYAGSGLMSVPTAFSNVVPNLQPYGDPLFDGTIMEYDEPVAVTNLPWDLVDWVVLSLRSSTASEDEIVRQVAFLREDGMILHINGEGPVPIYGVGPGAYYLVVCHRNHVCAMSHTTLEFSTSPASYDFTTNAGYTTGPPAQKVLETSPSAVYGLFAADANADASIQALDFNAYIAATTSGASGYEMADFNLDGAVQALDFNLYLANTLAGASSQVP
jgi:hypothetical protein